MYESARELTYFAAIGVYSAELELPCVLQMDELPAQQPADEGADVPATKWISHKQLQGEGLSSSVCKVAKLAAKHSAQGKQGIKRLFAAVAKE